MSGTFFSALFHNPFLQTALIAGFLASIASGIMGSYVVIKRIAFISGSIAHSVLSGMGLCLYLQHTYDLPWLNPLYGAFIAALISALIIGIVHLKFRQRQDSVIAAIWSSGMAIGVIFISITPASTVDLLDFLFGNILWAKLSDLYLLGILDIFIITIVARYYSRFLAISFDEEQARLRGIDVTKTYLLLICLIAVSVVLLIQVIGIILVIALLTLPPTIISLFTKKLRSMMFFSILLTMAIHFTGMGLSYIWNFPPGATIALLAAFLYGSCLIYKRKSLLS